MKKLSHEEFLTRTKSLNFNAFLSSASFEKRCFVIPQLFAGLESLERVYFYNSNEEKVIISNAERLNCLSNNSCLVELNSDEPVDNFLKIDDCLTRLIAKYSKPNLLIDITTFTHETLLILLRALELKKSGIGEIHIAYVGAKEYSFKSESDEDKWLSKGIQVIRTVLGYSGLTDPTQKNHLMILFGFESERTKKIIEEYEFDTISLGFANLQESVQTNHYKINHERHKALLNEYPNAKAFNFSLIDAYETKQNILDYLTNEGFDSMNTVIAPLNTKISTIGAGLAAIENENIQLAYAKPNIYNIEGYSIPNEVIYLDILDI